MRCGGAGLVGASRLHRSAVDTFGAGAGGTRNIAGNSSLHEQLEGMAPYLDTTAQRVAAGGR